MCIMRIINDQKNKKKSKTSYSFSFLFFNICVFLLGHVPDTYTYRTGPTQQQGTL